MPVRCFAASAAFFACCAAAALAQATEPFVGAHGAMTPGSYAGTVEGRAVHLDLWPDQSFHFTSGDKAAAGRWHADPARNALVLDLGGDSLVVEVRNSQRLRPAGAPEDGSQDLESSGTPSFATLRLPLSGMMTYFADAASIIHCATGQTHPIAQDGDYRALEQAYLDARPGPGEPLFVTMDALIEPREQMEGPKRLTVVPESFGAVFPGEDCSLGNHSLDLADAVWTITALGDVALDAAPASREPFVIFRAEDSAFAASVGCNMMRGGFTRAGAELTFSGQVASTMMACPDPVADWETRFGAVLAGVASFQIGGRTLRLLDADGNPLAELKAVYLP